MSSDKEVLRTWREIAQKVRRPGEAAVSVQRAQQIGRRALQKLLLILEEDPVILEYIKERTKDARRRI